jgi:hypothetical protein
MAGFLGALGAMAGLAANSRSQGQRQAQLDAIEKLKEQGLLQEQQANAMNLQDAIAQRVARQELLDDPNVDPTVKAMVAANLPASIVDSYKNQKKEQASGTLFAGIARLGKNDKAAAMKLAQDAAAAGLSPAEIKSAFSGTEYFRDPDSEEMKALRLIAEQNNIALQNQRLAGGTDTLTPVPATDITRVNGKTGYWARDKSGRATFVEMEGAKPKLNANEQKLVDSVNDITIQLPKFQQVAQRLTDRSDQVWEYIKYRAHGHMGTVDPDWAEYFNTVGQLQTDLVSAATSGSSRSFALIDMLRPHIPDPKDTPKLALDKMSGFDVGRFNAIRQSLMGEPPTPGSAALEGSGGSTPASTSGVSTEPPPPAGFK